MDVSQNTQSREEILKILEKFGFRFFGNNESGLPLVTAPNGQIVDINIAYNFLQSQLKSAHSASPEYSIESGIQFPNNMESINDSENLIEELEKDIERQKATKESSIENLDFRIETKNTVPTSPKIVLPNSSSQSIYSDGYSDFKKVDLDLTKPENVIALENFIQKNAKKNNSDPLKWLSYMFQKNLQELREEN